MAQCEYCKNDVNPAATVCGWCGKNPNGKTVLVAGAVGGLSFLLFLPFIKLIVIAVPLMMLVNKNSGFLHDMVLPVSALILIVFNKKLPFPSGTPGLIVQWLMLLAGIWMTVENLFK